MRRQRRKARPVTGILLLNKPSGVTSNAVLQRVKRLYQAAKTGHTGSLDPLARGLLPLCFGEATKLSAYLLDADKRYETCIRLGTKTATGDAEGEVLETHPVAQLESEHIKKVLISFLGEQQQMPPMFSAIKHQGRRLYELAREGRVVERKPRTIRIDTLELLSFDGTDLLLDIRCSKGTYVRTLAEDIGAAIGCGGHVAALKRIQVGPFTCEGMLNVEQLESYASEGTERLDACLLPPDAALPHWSKVSLNTTTSRFLQQGQAVLVPKAPTSGWVRIYDQDGRFLGVGEVKENGLITPRRLLVT